MRQPQIATLADAELFLWRQRAHEALDPLWQEGPHPSRSHAYRWLAMQLGLDRATCHVSLFDVETCQAVVEICEAYFAALAQED